ncbi:hypothetical protein BG005_000113 [Podila minutissima]|nr:hypothetical protein BG005_000113 [Podila minutissima]
MDSSLPPATLASLPLEILIMIFRNIIDLTQGDRYRCTLVSKTWYSICSPFLWHTVRPRNASQSRLLKDHVLHQALVRKAINIQRLHLTYPEMRQVFLPRPKVLPSTSDLNTPKKDKGLYVTPLCTNLRELHLQYVPIADWDSYKTECELNPSWPLSLVAEQEQSLAALLRHNTELHTLKIEPEMTAKVLVELIVLDMPNLQSLYVRQPLTTGNLKILLSTLPECIRDVHVRARPYQGLQDSLTAKTIQTSRHRNHHALEKLVIDEPFLGSEEFVLLPFLDTCSEKLQVFQVSGFECFKNEKVNEALGRVGIFLEDLDCGDMPQKGHSYDWEFAEVITLSSRWTAIYVSDCFQFGTQSVAALLNHSQHLQRLCLFGCGGISSEQLQLILCTAGALEYLWAIDDEYEQDPFDPILDALDMISSEWATKSLKEFVCAIRVPRVGDDSDLTDGEAREIQRRVYERLATQIQLETLSLGCRIETVEGVLDSHYHPECLQITLDSGLGELAHLKQLTKLDVSYTDHMISIEELQWMEQNWQRLATICGLSETYNPVPGALEWVRAHRESWLPQAHEDT